MRAEHARAERHGLTERRAQAMTEDDRRRLMERDPSKFACACCGYRTLDEPAGGTWAICPVCFWEDVPDWVDDGPRRCGSNSVGLRQAQRNFLRFGASEEAYRGAVRDPLPGAEARDEGWEPLDAIAAREAASIMREIEAAFERVTRNEGMSLHETIAADNYGDAEEFARMRALDTDRRWQDVRDGDLAEVCGVGGAIFLDDIGWRYHLPAYLRWWLVGDAAISGSLATDEILHTLDMKPDAENRLDPHDTRRVACLSADQQRCVARFLRWIERFTEDDYARRTAHQALRRVWSRFEGGAGGASPTGTRDGHAS